MKIIFSIVILLFSSSISFSKNTDIIHDFKITFDCKLEKIMIKNKDFNYQTFTADNIEVDKKILDAGHHHGSTYYEHLAFLKAIENNLDPEVSLEDGLIAVAVGEAAEKSIKLGRLVNLEEIIN